MRKLAFPFTTILSTALALCLNAAPAQAQATRTWVSGVGDDANPCSRTAPCKTFPGAISKTATGGLINCLDPGGFGAVTITKSITIDCQNTQAGILAAGTNGITVNGAGVVVILRGLSIEGIGTGLVGVNFIQGSVLEIEHCKIFGFQGGTAVGIRIAHSAGNAEVYVSDTVLSNNGTGAVGGGIQIRPTGTGSAQVVLNRVQANNNVFGIAADGSVSTGGINVMVRDSTANGNTQTGIIAATGATGTGIMVDRSAANHNTTGIAASGAGAIVRVGGSSITGNATGVSGVGVQSYLNNQLTGNAGGEVFGGKARSSHARTISQSRQTGEPRRKAPESLRHYGGPLHASAR